jgi:hypothetical protein
VLSKGVGRWWTEGTSLGSPDLASTNFDELDLSLVSSDSGPKTKVSDFLIFDVAYVFSTCCKHTCAMLRLLQMFAKSVVFFSRIRPG